VYGESYGCARAAGDHHQQRQPEFQGPDGNTRRANLPRQPVCGGGQRDSRPDYASGRVFGGGGTMTLHRCWVYGDDVNTDVIFPGKYTYTIKTPEEMAAHALEDLDPTFVSGVQAGDVIIAGKNWGCGSSREQAVIALKYAGVPV